MTSNGTPAKPNCAEGLRAGRNEIPVTQAPNVNTRWVVGGWFGGRRRGTSVCSRCTSLRRWPRWRRYVFQVLWIWMNPYGQISTRGVQLCLFFYLFPFSCTSLWKPNLISSFATGGKKKKDGSQQLSRCNQCRDPPQSTAQLFTISWLSKICVILIKKNWKLAGLSTTHLLTSSSQILSSIWW